MKNTALLLLGLLLYNCASNKTTTAQKITFPFKELINESQGGFNTAKFLVIKENTSSLETYLQINKIRKPGFDIPEIDYNKQMLFALFMGEKASGGYAISIDHITETANKLRVFIKERSPNGIATMAITSPFCIVLLDKSTKEIVFEKIK
ncbi:MAG: protease complex subunit PrcB family protein [Flavobacteriaceae bacterium]|nr:protease complex subunit PrcB family protein [Flavobacteriaceae bacterium]